jgi:hypothetical protein
MLLAWDSVYLVPQVELHGKGVYATCSDLCDNCGA